MGLSIKLKFFNNRVLLVIFSVKKYRLYSTKIVKSSNLNKLVQFINNNSIGKKLNVYYNINNIISCDQILSTTYGVILKSKKKLFGIDLLIFKEIYFFFIKFISYKLKQGNFPSYEKIYYLNTKKILLFNYQIISQSINTLFKAIFETNFSHFKNNFRYYKSIYTILKNSFIYLSNKNLFFKGYINLSLNNFNSKILINSISEKLKDSIFLNILERVLSFDFSLIKIQNLNSIIKNIQYFIVSSILNSIFFYKFDIWIQKYNFYFQKNNKINDELINKFTYLRYMNHFIIGFSFSKLDCNLFYKNVKYFLLSKLELNFEILEIGKNKISFLNTDIIFKKRLKEQIKNKINYLPIQKETIVPFFKLEAPIKQIIKKLVEKGFAKTKKGKIGVPTRIGRYIHLDLCQIIQKYIKFTKQILNYYLVANNYKQLRSRILYILKYSLALTFASKLKLRTLNKVFKKFGPNLRVRNLNGKFIEFNINIL